jgi:hypothetical protein
MRGEEGENVEIVAFMDCTILKAIRILGCHNVCSSVCCTLFTHTINLMKYVL